mmetsp:Transcript_81765/g.263921  ORF Transcript_81765/g.263921 Transcript_81765/m.263921 type:complete len:90 (+) Transcript_81765:125-394(+)
MSSTSATARCLSNSCCLFLVLRLLRGRRDDRGQRRRGEGLHGRGDQGQPSSVLLAPLRMDLCAPKPPKIMPKQQTMLRMTLRMGGVGLP